jgi:bifunctional non-homologous end joining protein LigD
MAHQIQRFERSVASAIAAFAVAIWGAARWDLGSTNRWYGEWRFAHAFSTGEIAVDVILIAALCTAIWATCRPADRAAGPRRHHAAGDPGISCASNLRPIFLFGCTPLSLDTSAQQSQAVDMNKSIRLEAASASGGKFYEAYIREVDGGFVVNFQFGALGDTARTGSKTPAPVDLAKAEKIFDALVKSKMTGGSQYREVTGGAAASAYIAPAAAMAANACLPPRLLNDIDPGKVLDLVADAAWWCQIKYDGDRVQLHATDAGVTLYSGRSAKTRNCPKAVADAVAPYRFVIDGELVGETLWAFDILTVGPQDFRGEAYQDRYAALESVLEILGCPAIRLVASAEDSAAKAALIVDAQLGHKEGVVFINALAPYTPGRPNKGGDNLRWKFTASASVIVAQGGNDKRSVDLELADGTRIGSCTIPVNREVPKPGEIVEVAYLYCQGSLVQAVYKGVRTDVAREACTRAQLQFKDGIDPRRGK